MKQKYLTDIPGVHWVDDFHESRAWFMAWDEAMRVNRCGFIDRKLRVVVAPGFAKLRPYSGGLAPYYDGAAWGFIDRRGRVVISAQFYDVGDGFQCGLCAVRRVREGHYGYIDRRGLYVIKPVFEYAFAFGNGRAKVVLDGHFYFIDRRGRMRTPAVCKFRGV